MCKVEKVGSSSEIVGGIMKVFIRSKKYTSVYIIFENKIVKIRKNNLILHALIYCKNKYK